MNKNFKKLAVGALMLSAVVSMPALAGKGFIKKDLSDRDTEVVQLVGEELSADKLVLVVHGGNRKLQMAAYRVAQRLDDEGVPVAFLLAPDNDGTLKSMHVDYYTKGATRFGFTAYDNQKNTVAQSEAGLYEYARKAYEEKLGSLTRDGETSSDE